MSKRAVGLFTLSLGLLIIGAGNARAGMYDLTGSTSAEATINGALFANSNQHSTGTGVLQPFVRLDVSGSGDIEKGYNTDAKSPPYDAKSGTWTHSLLLSQVPGTQMGGQWYREFLLDINQNANRPLLSLDNVEIYQLNRGDFAGTIEELRTLGRKVYDLGNDGSGNPNWLKLNYGFNTGSGGGDLSAYVPNNWFSPDSDKQYVYLYSELGGHEGLLANDGFEEWGVREVTSPVPAPVPLPGAVLLGALGLSCAGWRLRRKPE